MKSTVKTILILVSILLLAGCSIDIEEKSLSIKGSWVSEDNVYDGCYAYYQFGDGVYSIVKSRELNGSVISEEIGIYSADYKSNRVSLTSSSSITYTLDMDLESEKLFLEGDALHSLWKASRIRLLKLKE